ncbi:unnamed protein product [Tilletia laevis]|uniref:NAD(P)-binding protein n=2 Tax=Tilletia TaxID=13289 RepID=A0A177T8E4_9BASI|nr:hypothetical protein CF336_g8480 [Tilletia laevis]KAE8242523.1 hypothetical protein A4X03_0g8013 [Tilletia caries]CAD6921135.1 unnamed protein product [Tilletia controversa]KAE8184062.1 hypothetical protein CF335_g8135 [Tilletia laevis]CAD6893240.1 unnamed protein product [Tilletia caries]
MSEKPTALVVGASRGIGKALLDKLAQAGYDTYGTVRTLPPATKPSPSKALLQADLTDEASLRKAAEDLSKTCGDGLDLLIISGATAGDEPYLEIETDRLLDYYNTNVIGPLRAIRAFLPALRSRSSSPSAAAGQRTIVIITSLASNAGMRAKNALTLPIEDRLPISTGPYGSSKAALNCLGIGLYTELEAEGFKVLLVHPGLVNTDMAQNMIKRVEDKFAGGESPWKVLEVEESVGGIVDVVVREAGKKDGKPALKYVDWTGKDLPW